MPPAPNPVAIFGVVEGDLDEAVLRSLIRHAGAIPGPIHGKHGKGYIQKHLSGYNQAAHYSPWLVVVDLDQDADCAPPFRAAWLLRPAPLMCFRVAVREIEAWLLADRMRIAKFLAVDSRKVPTDVEAISDPKHAVLQLARSSRRKGIRQDMVPRPGSGREVGPAYNSRLIQFVNDRRNGWRPGVAAQSSESLHRCLRRLGRLVQEVRQ